MAYETILFDVEQGFARLTLNRPDRLNSFTVEMHGEVADALGRVERDDAIRALLLTGAGRGFCAGQDLSDRGHRTRPAERTAPFSREHSERSRCPTGADRGSARTQGHHDAGAHVSPSPPSIG